MSRSAASEANTHPPRVAGENFVLFLHHARVRALVDGVGHDGDVVVLQRDVVGVGVLQQLPIFEPAETAGRGNRTLTSARPGRRERSRHLLHFASL